MGLRNADAVATMTATSLPFASRRRPEFGLRRHQRLGLLARAMVEPEQQRLSLGELEATGDAPVGNVDRYRCRQHHHIGAALQPNAAVERRRHPESRGRIPVGELVRPRSRRCTDCRHPTDE